MQGLPEGVGGLFGGMVGRVRGEKEGYKEEIERRIAGLEDCAKLVGEGSELHFFLKKEKDKLFSWVLGENEC